jgi:putative hydrolase of the HAD superfamily
VIRAVLLDALGTLVRLEPPAPRLRAELSRLAGVEVSEEQAERGFRAEIAYYLQHHGEGRDPASLERLRDRCARVLADELGLAGVDHTAVRAAMLGSLEFTAFPDAADALRELRERALRLVVASNWDCSLSEVLERAGLRSLVGGVASSAVAGAPKPHPAVFEQALRLAGATPEEALHVGDSVENDVEGARAVGVPALLLVREGDAPAGVEVIRSLGELPSLVFVR